ncbi:MAG: glycoside hydrolase family 13 protein [Lachnospiraceae bacterium]|nr:glycoside hydrolase family 13 protein [Lachnospiraceae bacterium]MDD4524478.1 glycoside hydrolase family 13 protein [Lachnospiraceae bacterium]NLC75102.1 glycoside hydrolase family 13 protein [Clostridiales bacterium]
MTDFEINAIFSDYTSDYIKPWQPAPFSQLTILLRTAKTGVDHCTLSVRGAREYEMIRVAENDSFAWHSAVVELDDRKISWVFNVYTDTEHLLYTRRGIEGKIEEPSWWNLVPGFCVPKWMVGAVMYQIYVDRFSNGDESNDVQTDEYNYIGNHSVKVEDWNRLPQADDVREFYGGDIQGVINKLDYLSDLGVDVIYLNPLFVSPSNHKYDSQDYGHIDPHIGRIVNDGGKLLSPDDHDNSHASRYAVRTTDAGNLTASDELFALLVKEAHRRGIKVIIDGVFNHCGSFNKWLDRERIYEQIDGEPKGAYVAEDSPYHDYFQFKGGKWPYNGTYDAWWGHDTLPKLNYENSRALTDYVLDIGRKWVSAPFHADGWRLDVASDLGHSPEFNHHFWQEFRKAVKEANPDAVILAENYGDSSAWLQGNEWDTIMNYDAFMEPITWFLTGMEKHSDDFRRDLLNNTDQFWKRMTYYWNGAMNSAPMFISMNELSNHDHSRFLTRTNHKVGRIETLGPLAAEENVDMAVFREAIVMQMTWPGAPTVYYGDEAGLCGFTDPDNRRTYPWGRENEDLIKFHKEMIRIHKKDRCLIAGSVRLMESKPGCICYARFDEMETVLVIINNNAFDVISRTEPVFAGTAVNCDMTRIMMSDRTGYNTDPVIIKVENGKMEVKVSSESATIIRCYH